jgi:hypothetical protein
MKTTKRHPLNTCLIVVVAAFSFASTAAQNLESIGKKKPLTVSGGVSLSQIFYGANGIDSRRNPYSYFASGNVNISLYGWSVPLSFSVSNQNTTFQQPFNQYSLHPTYKWVTGHFGYTSMAYSPYTVNGHIFLGGGVDLAPEGKWKLSALYGRFLKAVQPSDRSVHGAAPAYKRMGYGLKASYGDSENSLDLIVFHAHDDATSIHIPDSLQIFPEENLVMSLGGGKTFFDNFLWRAEIAGSAISRDTRTEQNDTGHPFGKTGLYTSRVSSSYYKAFKTSFDYRQSGYTVGVGYERVDPQYRTLGAYYFNSDLENITLNGTVALLKGKMNVAVSGGTQHDNLDHSKISTMRRLVGSLNVNYVPSQKLNLSTSYSSFQTFTNIRSQFVDINQLTPYDNLDTLNYTQISQNATATAMYQLGDSKERRQSLNMNLSFQGAADKQNNVSQNSGSRFYTLNTSYSLNIVPKNLTVAIVVNGNVNDSPGFNTKTFGPTVTANKSFFDKKLRASVSTSYNNAYTNGQRVSAILNGRVGGSYTVQKKHNLNLSLLIANRNSQATTASQSFTEFTGTLGYSYAFSK